MADLHRVGKLILRALRLKPKASSSKEDSNGSSRRGNGDNNIDARGDKDTSHLGVAQGGSDHQVINYLFDSNGG